MISITGLLLFEAGRWWQLTRFRHKASLSPGQTWSRVALLLMMVMIHDWHGSCWSWFMMVLCPVWSLCDLVSFVRFFKKVSMSNQKSKLEKGNYILATIVLIAINPQYFYIAEKVRYWVIKEAALPFRLAMTTLYILTC